MNNRYLYRAKRTDNAEWMSGSYVNTLTEDKECPCAGIYKENHWIVGGNGNMVAVDPSTICQCTGLKDKNGKLIWENDMLVAYLDDEFPEDATYAQVIWRNSSLCLKHSGCDFCEQLDEFVKKHFEVIGNIFDNPELLEVGE